MSTKQTITSHLKQLNIKKTTDYDVGNSTQWGGVKFLNGIHTLPLLIRYLRRFYSNKHQYNSSENPSIIVRNYKEILKVQKTWHSLSTLPTMDHGLTFRIIT